MTATAEPITDTTHAPAPDAEPASSTIEVPELGTIGEHQLGKLTVPQLHEVLRALHIPLPAKARKPGIITMCVQALRLKALVESTPPQAALPAPAPQPGDGAPAAAESADAGQELEHRPESVVPDLSRWQLIQQMAEYLAKSNLTPEALRGKPHDVGSILLRAHDLGIPLTMALENLYVVHGKVGMEGKLMAALIRRDGHSLRCVREDTFCAVWEGTRRDNGDAGMASFDLDDAVTAELIESYERGKEGPDGQARWIVRPKKDKQTYRLYPKAMLKWRALAILARDLFSDCLAGVSYTPDELGFIDAPDEPRGRAGEPEPTITLHAQQTQIAERIEGLPEDLKSKLRDEWKRIRLPKPLDLTPAAIRQAMRLLEPIEDEAHAREEAAKAHIDEAELVPDGTPEPDAGTTDEGDGEQAGPGPVTGESGEPAVDTAADAATPAAPPEPASEDDDEERCAAGCGLPFTDDDLPVFDDQERAWHAACSPFLP